MSITSRSCTVCGQIVPQGQGHTWTGDDIYCRPCYDRQRATAEQGFREGFTSVLNYAGGLALIVVIPSGLGAAVTGSMVAAAVAGICFALGSTFCILAQLRTIAELLRQAKK